MPTAPGMLDLQEAANLALARARTAAVVHRLGHVTGRATATRRSLPFDSAEPDEVVQHATHGIDVSTDRVGDLGRPAGPAVQDAPLHECEHRRLLSPVETAAGPDRSVGRG